jgi:hypothetical protein
LATIGWDALGSDRCTTTALSGVTPHGTVIAINLVVGRDNNYWLFMARNKRGDLSHFHVPPNPDRT